MSTIRFRITGSQDQANTVVNELHGLDDIERVEEVDDQMRGMRDDSSSSELSDDIGPGLHCIEVDAPTEKLADSVRRIAANSARELDVVVEFVDRF